MTRRDYILMAEVLCEAKPIASSDSERGRQWTNTVHAFADRLQAESPTRFRRDLFLKACNAYDETILSGTGSVTYPKTRKG